MSEEKICPDGIILDIDGTIWNTTEVIAEAWNLAISQNYPQVPVILPETLKKEFGKTMKTIADDLFTGLTEDEKLILMEKCCECEQQALEKSVKDLTYKGVISSIKTLSVKYDFYIVSNCQKGYIEMLLKKTGMLDYFKDWECYGNNGNNKGDNIKLICSRNNLNNAIYVGDTQTDCEACKASGVKFIWASYGFGNPQEYFKKIDKFSDLFTLLGKN